jgi:hypothetical protein
MFHVFNYISVIYAVLSHDFQEVSLLILIFGPISKFCLSNAYIAVGIAVHLFDLMTFLLSYLAAEAFKLFHIFPGNNEVSCEQ